MKKERESERERQRQREKRETERKNHRVEMSSFKTDDRYLILIEVLRDKQKCRNTCVTLK